MPTIIINKEIPEGLKKISGLNVEEVIKLLGVKSTHGLHCYPEDSGEGEFRFHVIAVNPLEVKVLIDALEQKTEIDLFSRGSSSGYVVKAFYKITPKFNLSYLNGTYAFREGDLIEHTYIRLKDRLNSEEWET